WETLAAGLSWVNPRRLRYPSISDVNDRRREVRESRTRSVRRPRRTRAITGVQLLSEWTAPSFSLTVPKDCDTEITVREHSCSRPDPGRGRPGRAAVATAAATVVP